VTLCPARSSIHSKRLLTTVYQVMQASWLK
jgi:hypothetical protein